jgi:hypothetical protein
VKFQVVQKKPDLVTIHFVPEHGVEPAFEYFREQIAATCGEALRVEFEAVEDLRHEPGTKFRLVISELP